MRTFWRTVSPERKKLEEGFSLYSNGSFDAAEGPDERFYCDVSTLKCCFYFE
jgi:hypothetical protein